MLSILSGEFKPSFGNISLGGLELFENLHKCRRKIGYCPQFDALFDLLTGREHLILYAMIKGIKKSSIEAEIASKIQNMGLSEYAERNAGSYSGGNKVCLAY